MIYRNHQEQEAFFNRPMRVLADDGKGACALRITGNKHSNES